MLKRIVAERVRRSKRVDKFRLEDDDGDGDEGFGLTHRVSIFIHVDSTTCVYKSYSYAIQHTPTIYYILTGTHLHHHHFYSLPLSLLGKSNR